MKKVFKVLFLFTLIFSFTSLLPACSKRSSQSNEAAKVKIEDTTYPSLSEAVKNAKSGDTIRVFDDVLENRNILIDKPLSIVGVKNHNNINPKFYGSFTINASGENDIVTINGLDIIHKGTAENSNENNTKIGINLVDGGVTIKENKISLDNEKETDKNVAGIILSRKNDSINTMPMIVKGNTFGNYLDKSEGNCALVVKSAKDNAFKNIVLNNENLYRQNSFSFAQSGNQFLSIRYEQDPYKINYFVTSSSKELLDKLTNNQSSSDSTFILKNANEQVEKLENKIPIYKKTVVWFEGNKPIDLSENVFELQGTINFESDAKNATIEKKSNTASVIKNKNKKIENITIV